MYKCDYCGYSSDNEKIVQDIGEGTHLCIVCEARFDLDTAKLEKRLAEDKVTIS
jgi:hypothetical protein